MTGTMTLAEYKEISKNLPFVEPLGGYCGKPLIESVHIEPDGGCEAFAN